MKYTLDFAEEDSKLIYYNQDIDISSSSFGVLNTLDNEVLSVMIAKNFKTRRMINFAESALAVEFEILSDQKFKHNSSLDSNIDSISTYNENKDVESNIFDKFPHQKSFTHISFWESLPQTLSVKSIPNMGQSISNTPSSSDNSIKQLQRDLQRDQILINGQLLIGADAGLDGTMEVLEKTIDKLLEECDIPSLEQLAPIQSTLKQNFCYAILHTACRTNSGGVSYAGLQVILSKKKSKINNKASHPDNIIDTDKMNIKNVNHENFQNDYPIPPNINDNHHNHHHHHHHHHHSDPMNDKENNENDDDDDILSKYIIVPQSTLAPPLRIRLSICKFVIEDDVITKKDTTTNNNNTNADKEMAPSSSSSSSFYGSSFMSLFRKRLAVSKTPPSSTTAITGGVSTGGATKVVRLTPEEEKILQQHILKSYSSSSSSSSSVAVKQSTFSHLTTTNSDSNNPNNTSLITSNGDNEDGKLPPPATDATSTAAATTTTVATTPTRIAFGSVLPPAISTQNKSLLPSLPLLQASPSPPIHSSSSSSSGSGSSGDGSSSSSIGTSGSSSSSSGNGDSSSSSGSSSIHSWGIRCSIDCITIFSLKPIDGGYDSSRRNPSSNHNNNKHNNTNNNNDNDSNSNNKLIHLNSDDNTIMNGGSSNMMNDNPPNHSNRNLQVTYHNSVVLPLNISKKVFTTAVTTNTTTTDASTSRTDSSSASTAATATADFLACEHIVNNGQVQISLYAENSII